jgi:murein endopeptidase
VAAVKGVYFIEQYHSDISHICTEGVQAPNLDKTSHLSPSDGCPDVALTWRSPPPITTTVNVHNTPPPPSPVPEAHGPEFTLTHTGLGPNRIIVKEKTQLVYLGDLCT